LPCNTPGSWRLRQFFQRADPGLIGTPGGQQQLVFRIAKRPGNAQYRDLLEASHRKWDFEFCYCSAFEACWEVLGKWKEPEPVEACARNDAFEFLP